MNKLLRLSTVLLVLSASLSGCMLQQPLPMYRLENGATELPEQSGGPAVLLGPVTLADYLQRDALLQRLPDGSLAADAQQARWAGSLQGDVEQLLLRQLAWRLKTQRLQLSPAGAGFAPEVQVELAITRLDSGPAHPAVLEAQWRLLDKQGKQQGSRLVRLEEAHQGSTADQVHAQSVLLQRLSEMLAAEIEPLATAKPAVPKREPAKAQNKSAEADMPRIPAIEPIRTDMEVFRF
ncbi:ABC-type transport auxiliary lipoprotein family protein [Stutzerimonas stutzeri]|uniref:PqiC family protein n=1 Tax=Stutzerimonas sp. S1 TaxID=3030652 RepID=UPI002224F902|nr:PqiC family protein [Stutzerimonas sp. S1]MCW3147333.1 ABC-type transport auxiliary lipoprotein family protein [Stutzerimonas sp. S1]